MTTTPRPVVVDTPPPSTSPAPPPQPELPIAKDLPPWDLVPSDLLAVRRRIKK